MSAETYVDAPCHEIPQRWKDAVFDAALVADKTPELETCGAILRDGGRGCYFVPIENSHPEPQSHCLVRKKGWDRYVLRADAFLHSHPTNPYPSERDMHKQEGTGLPWVVLHRAGHFAWGGDLKRPPLVGRGFRHGTSDCFSLIRDWYEHERGIELPVCPRAWDWWNSGQDLYAEGFHRAGFVEVSRRGEDPTEIMRAPRPGDVLLFRVRSPVINHGAVYLGHGLMLHHPSSRQPYDPSRISARVSIFRWARYCERVLRYAD